MRDPVTERERAWMKALEGETWSRNWDERSRRHWMCEKRELTPGEVFQLWKIILRHQLPCEMVNTAFGFHVGILVFDHTLMPDMSPEGLFMFSGTQIPGRGKMNGRHFKEEFDFFKRLTHSEENLQLLDYYKLERPREMSHYDY